MMPDGGLNVKENVLKGKNPDPFFGTVCRVAMGSILDLYNAAARLLRRFI